MYNMFAYLIFHYGLKESQAVGTYQEKHTFRRYEKCFPYDYEYHYPTGQLSYH